MERLFGPNDPLPYDLVVFVKDAPPTIEVDNDEKKILLSMPPKSKVRPSFIGPVLTHPELPPHRLVIGKDGPKVFARLVELDPMMKGVV